METNLRRTLTIKAAQAPLSGSAIKRSFWGEHALPKGRANRMKQLAEMDIQMTNLKLVLDRIRGYLNLHADEEGGLGT